MARPKNQIKGNKVAAYSIKNNKICKLNNSRYVPVTDEDEIAKAKQIIMKQLGIKDAVKENKTVTVNASPVNSVQNTQEEIAKQPSIIEGQSTRMAANNMWGAARINYEIKLLGDKIVSKISGQETDKRELGSYGVPSLIDVLACTDQINTQTEEIIKSLHQFIDENL